MGDVTVCVGTFGERSWAELAIGRAVPSAAAEVGPQVIHAHRATLSEARNAALDLVRTEWVIFLDADDEFQSPGYVDAMLAGTADVRGPMARYIHPNGRERLWQPRVAGHTHDCTADCLPEGNWLLVGSMVRTELLRKAGAWHEFSWSEDWSTWIRCWKAGGTFELVPSAVYRAHVRADSRNRSATRDERQAAHEQIHRAEFPEMYETAA